MNGGLTKSCLYSLGTFFIYSKYETIYAKETLKYLHHWVVYECNKQYETEFLKNNTEPAPGPCAKEEANDSNYITNWYEARQYCQKISLVWAVGGDMVQQHQKKCKQLFILRIKCKNLKK